VPNSEVGLVFGLVFRKNVSQLYACLG